MSERQLARRRILALVAILAMFGNAVWLSNASQVPKPFFVFKAGPAYEETILDIMAKFEGPISLPNYDNGQWYFNGTKTPDITPYVRRGGLLEDAADRYLIYPIEADATMVDFVRSTRDAWSAGAQGSMALVPEGFAYTGDPIIGIEIYEH